MERVILNIQLFEIQRQHDLSQPTVGFKGQFGKDKIKENTNHAIMKQQQNIYKKVKSHLA